ncbi:MAG TPA: hypothetical protein VHN20_02500 [Beijerinckiaceae bacterium]|nr:hypothetical protein [Beijerinckiaceae bacterium]
MMTIGRRLGVVVAWLAGNFSTTAIAQESIVTAQKPFSAAPARPGDIAVREEFEAARRAGTIAAYDLFVARHPEHALADTARRERERLTREGAARPRRGSKP